MTHIGTILKTPTDPIHDLDRFSLTPAGYAVLHEKDAAAPADTILETNAAVQSVRQAYDGPSINQPKPEWVRGVCPLCAGPVVSNAYYVGGRGYLVTMECWGSLNENPTCTYRKVL